MTDYGLNQRQTLAHAKSLLDEHLISQAQYEKVQSDALAALSGTVLIFDSALQGTQEAQ